MVDPNPLFTLGVNLDGIPAQIDTIETDVAIVKDQLDPNVAGSLAKQVAEELDPKTVNGLKSDVAAVKDQLDPNVAGSLAKQVVEELDPKAVNGLKSDVTAVKGQLDPKGAGSLANQIAEELNPNIDNSLKSDVTIIKDRVDWQKPENLTAQVNEIKSAISSLRHELRFIARLQRHIFWLEAARTEKLDSKSIDRAIANADKVGQLVSDHHHHQLSEIMNRIYPPEG
jgi:hypothetical protein